MDTFCTPKSAMSSVFLTPPFSTERTYQELNPDIEGNPSQKSRLPLIQFLTLTPEKVPEDDKFDILSFLSGPFPQISHSILSHLSPSDLSSCLAVSKSWRSVVLSKKSFRDSVCNYRKERRKEQENIFMKQCLVSSPPQTPRLPLNTVPSNITSSNAVIQQLPPFPATECNLLLKDSRYPCPQCNSPAKNVTKASLQCDACHFQFCPKCFKPTHAEQNCCVGALSPRKRQNSSSIAGSSKSKRRLRRL